MDPNEALRFARDAAARLIAQIDSAELLEEAEIDFDDVDTLVEAFDALDHWMSRGGYLPAPWRLMKRTGS